jgi:DNA-binding protein
MNTLHHKEKLLNVTNILLAVLGFFGAEVWHATNDTRGAVIAHGVKIDAINERLKEHGVKIDEIQTRLQNCPTREEIKRRMEDQVEELAALTNSYKMRN